MTITATKPKTKIALSLAEMRTQLDAPAPDGRLDPFVSRPKAADLPDELVEPFWRVIVLADRRIVNQRARAAHPSMRQAAVDADAAEALDSVLAGREVKPGQNLADHDRETARLQAETDALQIAYDDAVTNARAAVAWGFDVRPTEGVATGYVHHIIEAKVAAPRTRVLEALTALVEADRALDEPRKLANWYARAAWPHGAGHGGADIFGVDGKVELRKGVHYSSEVLSANSVVVAILADLEEVAAAVRDYIAPVSELEAGR